MPYHFIAIHNIMSRLNVKTHSVLGACLNYNVLEAPITIIAIYGILTAFRPSNTVTRILQQLSDIMSCRGIILFSCWIQPIKIRYLPLDDEPFTGDSLSIYIYIYIIWCTTITMIKLRSDLHSRTTPHTSSLQVRHGVYFVIYTDKMTALYRECTVFC